MKLVDDLITVGIASTVVVSLYAGWRAREQSIGADKATKQIVAASQAKGEAANDKSKKVRDAAAFPGAAERLRSDPATCRDCVGKPVP